MKDKTSEVLILKAAKTVFIKKGMDGARMQEIADEAGINKALLHYYYRSKQQLFEAVFFNAFSLLAPQINYILNDDSSVEEKIIKFTENYISFVSQHPYLPNFVIQEINRNPDFASKFKGNSNLPNLEKFKIQVSDEVKKGLIKPINAEQLFINIISLCVFPFVGSPLIKTIGIIDDERFTQIIDERKTHVADFIINSIKI
ncbi:helix-turn-helix domain-containing protein [Gaetbulibacter sp. M235]|uniref:TetR/AcrR family transcriptional regulator n=1 Tax=Gaetbulibacter sp. M235 TaxID=3126510 RepID=UPI00374F0B83